MTCMYVRDLYPVFDCYIWGGVTGVRAPRKKGPRLSRMDPLSLAEHGKNTEKASSSMHESPGLAKSDGCSMADILRTGPAHFHVTSHIILDLHLRRPLAQTPPTHSPSVFTFRALLVYSTYSYRNQKPSLILVNHPLHISLPVRSLS